MKQSMHNRSHYKPIKTNLMPEFLEKKLKKEYGNNPKAIYGTMNKLGYMKGNKETAKGRNAEKKHQKDALKNYA